MKMSIDQSLRKARSLARGGEIALAEAVYRDVLEHFPANKRVRAELEALAKPFESGNPPAAVLDELIDLYRRGRHAEALGRAEQLLETYPNGEILLNIAGVLSATLGHFEPAVAYYDKALEAVPTYAEAHNNRGNALRALKQLDAALASFDAVLRLEPRDAVAHMNRGIVLNALKRPEEALASHDRAIQLGLDRPESHNNRATVLYALHRYDEALSGFDRALRLAPGYAEAHVNRGNTLKALRRADEAIESYDRALAIAPRLIDAHHNRGILLRECKRLNEALASHEKAIACNPDHAAALSEIVSLRAQMCVWGEHDDHHARLLQLTDQGAIISPFYMFNLADDPARQLACASAWSRSRYPAAHRLSNRPTQDHRKIRVGYFSADFHNHATMYLMARLFELHDRSRFEIHAFSYGPEIEDEMRVRVRSAVDAFHSVEGLSDLSTAALARELGIDLAIDLKGHTEGGRLGIFAHRAAPVQISYLGYPGSTGCDFIDYVIADRDTIPERQQHCYTEQVLYLPNSYQVNDDRRVVAETQFRKSDLGLPANGFVFCCFNNSYKISPAEFDIWMRLLTRIEGSVLWLLEDNQFASANLRREAERRGVDASRLVFGRRMPLAEHLARQRCADLFLDTFKVNAHTTASDALWVGLPVLTKPGNSFVSRVAASLLRAAGLPDLIAETPELYEEMALELATEPARLAEVKARLAANRSSMPLFATARFAADLEAVYEGLVNR